MFDGRTERSVGMWRVRRTGKPDIWVCYWWLRQTKSPIEGGEHRTSDKQLFFFLLKMVFTMSDVDVEEQITALGCDFVRSTSTFDIQ